MRETAKEGAETIAEQQALGAGHGTALRRLRTRLTTELHRVGVSPALARFALLVFAISRAALVALTAVVTRTLAPIGPPGAGGGWFLSSWVRYDATLYARLATDGYSSNVPYREAFFPLMPWIVHLVTLPFGGSRDGAHYIAAIVISNAAYLVALWGLAALAQQLWPGNAGVAKRAMLYLSVFPASLFLFAGYAESLFLAFAIWSLVAMSRRAWWLAGALGLLAALTRQMGVFLALPFAYEYGRAVGWRMRRVRADACAVALFPAGVLIFSGWLWLAAGSPLGFVQAQARASHHPSLPWITLWDTIRPFIHDLHMHTWVVWPHGSDLLCIALVAVLIVMGARQLPPGQTAYAATVWLLAVCYATPNWPLQSDARYMLAAFPALLVLAWLGHRRWLNAVVLAVFAVFSLMMTLLFVRGALIL